MTRSNQLSSPLSLPILSLLAAAFILALTMGQVEAQAPGVSRDTAPAGGQGRLQVRKPVGGKTSGTPAPATAGKPAPGAATTGAREGEKAASAGDPAAEASQQGLVGRLVDFVVARALWIVLAFAVGLGAIIYFTLRGGRAGSDDGSPAEWSSAPAGTLAESEGPRRTLTPPATAAAAPAVEREYALVVNQEDLKKPPLPQEAAPTRKAADCGPIQDLLAHDNFDGAYRQYVERIEADGQVSFLPDVERRLGEHFLNSGDLEKAARVLEHHVATHNGDQIDPQTYFNLGYIHFKGKTLNKSRRYFRLFVERQNDPTLAERGMKLLARLDKVQNLN